MEERRGKPRRQRDQDLLDKIAELQGAADRRATPESDEAKRKRRRAIRHNCQATIQMLIGHKPGEMDTWEVHPMQIKGRVLDLSRDGASLFAKQPFEADQELRVMITLRDGTKVQANSTVRWLKAVPEKDGYAFGVRFGHLPEKEAKRIGALLEELDATAGL